MLYSNYIHRMNSFKENVLQKEQLIKSTIDKQNVSYDISNRENYNNYKYQVSNNEDFAQFIYENYHDFKDEDIKYLVTRCLSIEDMRRILLEFELTHRPNYQSSSILSTNEFILAATKILNRYQSKGGGYKLEDSIWNINTVSPVKIKFTNTIDISLIDDEDLNIFVDTIVNRLNELSINYKVSSSYKDDTNMKLAVITISAKKYVDDQ